MIKTTSRSIFSWFCNSSFGMILVCCCSIAEGATNILTLLGSPALIVRQASDTTSTWLYLRNDSTATITVSLSAGDFISKTTGKALGAQITFTGPGESSPKPIYATSLAPDSVLIIKASASNIWEAGESEAVLYNKGVEIGKLKALKYRVPFGVELELMKPDSPMVSFEHGRSSRLILKNNDAMTYAVSWELVIRGKADSGKGVILPRNGTNHIEVNPPNEWFASWFTGLFKEEAREGMLTLRLQPSASTDDPSLPMKTISITAHLSYWSKPLRDFLSNVIIFVVLAAGGLSSLILSYWIPNHLRRLDLKEELNRIAEKIRDLSCQIDSSLRVLVRMERRRLNVMLESRSVISPELAGVFAQISQGIATLNKRIDLLEQIDSTYDRLQSLPTSEILPTVIDQLEKNLRKAARLLRSTEPKEDDFQTAKGLVDKSISRLDRFNEMDQELATILAERVKRFQAVRQPQDQAVEAESIENYKSIQPRLQTLLHEEGQKDFTDPSQIPSERYADLDAETIKFELENDYKTLKGYGLQIEDATDEEMQKVLNKLEKDFQNDLRRDSLDALRSAQRVVRQMKEGIFAKNILDAIKNRKVSIEWEPRTVRANQPTQLRVWFHLAELNRSAAREEFTCVWDFDHDDLTETGWVVSHFFPEGRTYEVKAHFQDAEGQEIKNADGNVLMEKIKVQLEQTVTFGDRARIEATRLAIVLFATLLGLIAGAREQLLKLDVGAGLIAVFLLGFGADTIKNLLTQRQMQT
jgi:hypothetical protein